LLKKSFRGETFGSRSSVVAVVALAACSDDDDGGPTAPGLPPPASATISVTTGGVNPSEVTVQPGGQVTFTNSDSVVHEMSSDPHPAHTECPELNGGALDPGQSFTATMGGQAKTCGFHDHRDPGNRVLQGTVRVSTGG
jgi:plastocyanin